LRGQEKVTKEKATLCAALRVPCGARPTGRLRNSPGGAPGSDSARRRPPARLRVLGGAQKTERPPRPGLALAQRPGGDAMWFTGVTRVGALIGRRVPWPGRCARRCPRARPSGRAGKPRARLDSPSRARQTLAGVQRAFSRGRTGKPVRPEGGGKKVADQTTGRHMGGMRGPGTVTRSTTSGRGGRPCPERNDLPRGRGRA
jgi:hypothetical protein